MSCLLCLRNEGIQFPNESPNDLEILLNLFKLPKDLSQRLQGNLCCSLCRVKLQFVEVINQEILILGQKLKCLEEEVKEIFVSSFNGNNESSQTHGNSTQARINLLKEMNIIVVETEETGQVGDETDYGGFEGEDIPSENHISTLNYECPWQPDNDNSKILISVPFTVETKDNTGEDDAVFNEENEIFISPENQVYIVGDDEDQVNQNSYQVTSNESNFESSRSFVSVQTNSPLVSFSSTIAKIKLEKMKKREKIPAKLSSTKLNSRRKLRISICKTCENADGVRLEFDRSEDFEKHLKIVHPSRPYSKCSICSRVLPEDSIGSQSRLAVHMKKVHITTRSFKCKQCGATFKAANHLKTHSEIHLKREIFICEHCDSTIKGERNFKYHMKRQHPEFNYTIKTK